MKTSTLLSAVLAIAFSLGILHPAVGRTPDGYSIEVKVTPKEGEARITEVTGIALEQNWRVELPLTLSHSENPATVSLDFELALGTVAINIHDLKVVRGSDRSILQQRDFFEADLFFEFGKEKTICATAAETISFTVTAPAAEKEAGTAEDENLPRPIERGAVDVSKLEVEFRHTDERIYAHIYNPTEQSITKMVVRVTAAAAGDFKGFDRRYLGNIGLKPLAEESMQIEARLPELPDGVEYQIALESAR